MNIAVVDSVFMLGPVLVLLFILLGLLAFIFWLWMLVECASKEPSHGNEKIIWMLVIIFLNGLGATLYFFIRRPQRIAEFG